MEPSKDKERNRVSKAHSPTGDRTWRDQSGRETKTDRARRTHVLETAQGATGQDTERSRPPRRTHKLEMAQGRTSQDTERSQASEAHSPPGDRTWRDQSGHETKTDSARRTHVLETAQEETSQDAEKKPTEQGALTFWRRHREGRVRTQKENDRSRRTHVLETAQEDTSQDTETNRQNQPHSLSEDRTGRGKSEHEKKPAERGGLTSWRRYREG